MVRLTRNFHIKQINTMSNTPLTAKAKIACGFQAVPQSFLEHAENLERENDTLRKAHHKYKSTLHDLRSVLEVTPLESLVQAAQRLVAENAALREAKDAYFKHNNILVELMTEDQKQKALEILMSRPKEAQS